MGGLWHCFTNILQLVPSKYNTHTHTFYDKYIYIWYVCVIWNPNVPIKIKIYYINISYIFLYECVIWYFNILGWYIIIKIKSSQWNLNKSHLQVLDPQLSKSTDTRSRQILHLPRPALLRQTFTADLGRNSASATTRRLGNIQKTMENHHFE